MDMGPFEAMEAMGANKTRAFISAIVPQVLPSYLSNCLFCFEGNVRYASILGYVGAGGLGIILNEKKAGASTRERRNDTSGAVRHGVHNRDDKPCGQETSGLMGGAEYERTHSKGL